MPAWQKIAMVDSVSETVKTRDLDLAYLRRWADEIKVADLLDKAFKAAE